MTILGLARTHRQNGLSYVPKKILTWGREGKGSEAKLREAKGGLKKQQ